MVNGRNKNSSESDAGTRQLTLKSRIERLTVKKIVIISQQGRVNHELVTLLTALFPECDINVAAADKQGLEPCPAGSFSESDMADETGET
jgi:hypothetical protein